LADRYGAAVLSASGVEARLRQVDPSVPLNPLFAAFFAARADVPVDAALAEATAVTRVGDAHAGHLVFGRRLREVADRARQLVATAANAKPADPPLIWSSSASYKERSR
jgi:hypothetical protein